MGLAFGDQDLVLGVIGVDLPRPPEEHGARVCR